MVTVMVKGRGKKDKFDFWISEEDIMFIETAVKNGWVASKAQFLNDAVHRYKPIIRAINATEEEYFQDECARIRKRIYGDGERDK